MLSYIGPVLIVLLSRPLLGERVGLHQWLGISIAFTGVVVVLRPDSMSLPPAALAIFGSALCWALLSISNRRLAGEVSTGVLTFYTVPISALLAGMLTVGNWTPPVGTDWLLFAIAGCCGAGAHLLVAHGLSPCQCGRHRALRIYRLDLDLPGRISVLERAAGRVHLAGWCGGHSGWLAGPCARGSSGCGVILGSQHERV